MDSRRFYSLFLAFILFCNIPMTNLYALAEEGQPAHELDMSQEELEAQLAQFQIYLDNILNSQLDILKGIDAHFQNLAGMINNKQLPKIKNREEITSYITQIRTGIKSILQEAFVQVTPEQIIQIIIFVRSLEMLMIESGKSHFNNLTKLEMKHPFTKAQLTTENLPHFIENEHKKNIELFQQVEYQINNAGITWYNKLYRGLDYYIIEPAKKYSLVSRGTIVVATAAATVYYYQRRFSQLNQSVRDAIRDAARNEKKLELQIPYTAENNWIIKWFGESVQRGIGNKVENPQELQWLGKTEGFLGEYNPQEMPLAYFGFGMLLWPLLKDEYTTLSPKISQFFSYITNRLKGGIYLKKADNYLDSVDARYTFDDLIGAEEVKETFSFIINYMLDPEAFDRAGIRPPKAYLFSGKTRTGKTYCAEAIAGEINKTLKAQGGNKRKIEFFTLDAADLNQIGIKKIMTTAKQFAPCIIFIDEIDLLQLNRCGDTKTLSEFLITLSGCMELDPNKQVIIIGATNKPENLDHALRQNGRFGKEIRFELPTFQNRKDYWIRELKKRSIDIDSFNVDQLALETEDCSYEQLGIILSSALQKAKVLGLPLSYALIEKAFDQEVRNILQHGAKKLSPLEKRSIAAHQAGQVLTNELLETERKLSKVTIRPMLAELRDEMIWEQYGKKREGEEEEQKKIEYGKMFTYHLNDTLHIESEEEQRKHCKVLLAGRIAQEIILGSCSNYNYKDREQAYTLVKRIVFAGINPEQLTKKQTEKYCDKALAVLEQFEHEVLTLLEQHKDKLESLSQALEQYETLDAQQVHEILKLNLEEK